MLEVEEDLNRATGSVLTQLMALLRKLQLQHLAASHCISGRGSTAVLK